MTLIIFSARKLWKISGNYLSPDDSRMVWTVLGYSCGLLNHFEWYFNYGCRLLVIIIFDLKMKTTGWEIFFAGWFHNGSSTALVSSRGLLTTPRQLSHGLRLYDFSCFPNFLNSFRSSRPWLDTAIIKSWTNTYKGGTLRAFERGESLGILPFV